MKHIIKKYKVFKWERCILQIPLNFTKLYIRHTPARASSNYRSRVFESWKIFFEIDDKKKEYCIPEAIYNEINKWIENYESAE